MEGYYRFSLISSHRATHFNGLNFDSFSQEAKFGASLMMKPETRAALVESCQSLCSELSLGKIAVTTAIII